MLRLEFMPEATRKNFERLSNDPLLNGFTLVGGTALAVQVGHRISEDLDFNIFGRPIPKRSLERLLSNLENEGAVIESLIAPERKVAHRINTGYDLDDTIQDYLIDGSKVTFHSRSEQDRPKAQIEHLQKADTIKIADHGFEVLGLHGLFVMKSILPYDRVRSRDLFDLMVLIRDHGFSLDDVFSAIAHYQPARHRDPEYFKSVATGLIALDADDEGFQSIGLVADMDEIYKYFRRLIDEHEMDEARMLLDQAPAPSAQDQRP